MTAWNGKTKNAQKRLEKVLRTKTRKNARDTYGMWDPLERSSSRQWWESSAHQAAFTNALREFIGEKPIDYSRDRESRFRNAAAGGSRNTSSLTPLRETSSARFNIRRRRTRAEPKERKSA